MATDRAPRRDKDVAAQDLGTASQRRRRPIAFGLHQFFEYLLAVTLVVVSVHIGGSTLLLVAGVVFGVLAVTARGPLGLVRLCGPRLHAVLDIIACLFLALSPLLLPLRPGVAEIVAVEVVAVVWLRVSLLTRYAARATLISDVETTQPETSSDAPTTIAPNRPTEPGAPVAGPTLAAIRNAGRITAAARRRLPEAQTALDSGARKVGGQAGRLHRAWRRAGR
jgi:hypothetical protein